MVIRKHWFLHDFCHFLQQKCSSNIEVFFSNWRSLAAILWISLCSIHETWCRWLSSLIEPKKSSIFADVMEILRHVHGTRRKIGDFYEKASLLDWKTSEVTATSFAFDSLTDSNELIGSCEKGSSRFINHGDPGQQTLTPARFLQLCLLHDFDNFLQKNAPRISKFF